MSLFNKKVGIIGLGKRYFNVYREILETLQCDLYVWNRTENKTDQFAKNKTYTIIKSIDDFKNLDLDLCLTFLPGNVSFDVLKDLKLKCSLLIETPVTDKRWLTQTNVGVLEQWIYLPVEQMKEVIYDKKLMARPYWVFNDGRSFDYHAIAQLRKYTECKKPKLFFGRMQNIKNEPGFIDKNGTMNTTPDSWLHGMTTLSNDTILMHSFTYNCKMTDLKAFQLLRCASCDGSIVSGRTHEMDNDYEKFEVRYLTADRKVKVSKVMKKEENNKFLGLFINDEIFWKNKYSEYNFSDQQIAISDLMLDGINNNLYKPEESYCDHVTIMAMKQSSMSNSLLAMQ